MMSLQGSRTGLRAATHTRSSSLVPSAYKRNNQQPRQPGWADLPPLPPLDPKEYTQQQPPNNPQQEPAWQPDPFLQPAATPPGAPGYIDAPYTPNRNPSGQPGYNPNRRQGGGGGGFQQQPAYQPNVNAPGGFWAPPPSQQNGGWGRNNGRNNNRGFQGFDDQTADMLLQDLADWSYTGFPQDRWYNEEEEIEVEEDTSPKYVNGKRVLVNKEIQAPTVRVQDAQKMELGVMSYEEARQLALKDSIDVVLINESGDPPVVRLIQFGKYKFELERAAKQKQKSSKGTETKELRLRPVTEPHDYEVKVKQARNFLVKGSKVKLTMQFSGRELRFKDQGKEMMLKLIEELSSTSKMDAPLSLRPSTFSVTLSPLK